MDKANKEQVLINKRMTSIDVAKAAGVSQSTVSRAFYNDSKLKEETRKKVLAVAKELGYKPNAIARSLISNKTNIIGIVMGDVDSPFYAYILTSITQRLREIGKQILVFNVKHNEEVDSVLSSVLQYQVDGIIITHASISTELATECTKNNIPVVLFNRFVPGATVSAVCCDNVTAVRDVVNYLVQDKGFKNIAYITGSENSSTNLDRKKGFIDRLRELGIDNYVIEFGDYTYESGKEAVKKILEKENIPQVIFCASDLMALGVMDYLRFNEGIKIPEDIAIVGFDDIYMASWPSYSLTTVHQPIGKMVDALIQLLENKLSNSDLEPVVQLYQGELVIRNSTEMKL